MKSLLHTLNDNDAVLLMYLFDELPADDRVEVEAMLATDAGLRAELEQLRAMHGTISGAMEVADKQLGSPRAEAAARRQIGKVIDQWVMRRDFSPAAPAPKAKSPLTWVLYATGVAAAVLIGFSYYWVMNVDTPYIANTVATTTTDSSGSDEMHLVDSFKDPESTDNGNTIADAPLLAASDLLRRSLDVSEEMLNDSLTHVDLTAAESEIKTVAQLSDVNTINGEFDVPGNLLQ